MATYDPKTIRPRRDFALVKADPRKEQVGLILLPVSETGVEKVTERAGTIVKLGPGDKAKQIDLAEGDRIVYRGFLKHANPVETVEGEYFLMSVDDVLCVLPKDGSIEVGCFSGRPESPERR